MAVAIRKDRPKCRLVCTAEKIHQPVLLGAFRGLWLCASPGLAGWLGGAWNTVWSWHTPWVPMQDDLNEFSDDLLDSEPVESDTDESLTEDSSARDAKRKRSGAKSSKADDGEAFAEGVGTSPFQREAKQGDETSREGASQKRKRGWL